MILVSEVKDGTAIKLDGKIYKVPEAIRHEGSGQVHGFTELKLRNLMYGHIADRRFNITDKVENIELTGRQMDFLYADADTHTTSWILRPVTRSACRN